MYGLVHAMLPADVSYKNHHEKFRQYYNIEQKLWLFVAFRFGIP